VGSCRTVIHRLGSALNVQRAPQQALRHPHRSRLPWIRAFLLEAQRSDLVVSILKKSQNRNKRASGGEGTIQLLLIIMGQYPPSYWVFTRAWPHHTTTSNNGQETQNTCRLRKNMTWHCQTELGKRLRYPRGTNSRKSVAFAEGLDTYLAR
jgi:hypothetical protein